MARPSPLGQPMPWDLVAPAYTDEVAPMLAPYATDALELARVRAGARIVDVACGPGTLAFVAARRGLHVDALDFSPEMIAKLEALRGSADGARITARVGDGMALPYPDGAHAAGFSMFGLMFFPDRARGFSELRRVLEPGARAVVSSWTRLEDVPAMAAMFGSMRETFTRALGPNAPQPGANEMPLSSQDHCHAEMSAAFADVEVHRVVHAQRYESATAMWQSIERTMAPMVLLRRQLGDARWAPIADAARDAIERICGTGTLAIEMPALLSVGLAR